MSGKQRIMPTSVEKSPERKRVKFNCDFLPRQQELNNKNEKWTLRIQLNPVIDVGIGRLDSNDSDSNEKDLKLDKENSLPAKSKAKQITTLENSLPENTLQKLTSGELDHLLLKNSKTENKVVKERIDYFCNLSDEIVLCILQKLPRDSLADVKLVSRRFHRLAEDESLWTKMDVSNTTLVPGEFGKIMSRQVVILRAARTEIRRDPFEQPCRAILPNFRSRLMYLDLSMASISTHCLTEILTKCKRLQKISLENVPVDDMALAALAGNKDIEVINLAMSTGIEIEGLKYLLTNCRKIKELNISWTYLTAPAIDYLCENLPSTLDRLNLSGCRKLLEDNNLQDLVTNCPHIRELDLSDCTALTGVSLRYIIQLEALDFLGLSRCYLIPYKTLFNLKKIKRLSYLQVHGGYIDAREIKNLKEILGDNVTINKFLFSSIARPTVGCNRSSIWNIKIR